MQIIEGAGMLTTLGLAASILLANNAPVDLAEVLSMHGKKVHVRGLVSWASPEHGGLVALVPESGRGQAVLAGAGHGKIDLPAKAVGRMATVRGLFYTKVYPAYRLKAWQKMGWRAKEKLPGGNNEITETTANNGDRVDITS
jgi:hypothetical protein